jgi:hypothetical protein
MDGVLPQRFANVNMLSNSEDRWETRRASWALRSKGKHSNVME